LSCAAALWPEDDTLAVEAQKYFDGTIRHLLQVLMAFDSQRPRPGIRRAQHSSVRRGRGDERIAYLDEAGMSWKARVVPGLVQP